VYIMKFHAIGDSHCCYGWHNIRYVNRIYLGSKLCYSVGLREINLQYLPEIEDGDVIIFCFGEIDCRCHVHKHITESVTYQMIIDDMIANYLARIKESVSHFSKIHVCVYNIIPPMQKDAVKDNPDYPFLGSDEERKSYYLYFNSKCKEKCAEYGFIFFDIYDKYCDENGFLNKRLSDGTVHIGNGLFIHEFIQHHLLPNL